MKKTHFLLGFKLACMAAAIPVCANAASVTLTISGVVKASPCTPSLEGSIDYGTISRSQLKPADYAMLGYKRMKLSVQCQSPTMFSVKVTDNRASTVPPAGDLPPFINHYDAPVTTFGKETHLGLGRTSGNKPIGAYVLMFKDVKVDGRRENVYANAGKGGATVGHMDGWYYDAVKQTHFGASRNGQPLAGKDFTFEIGASASLVKAGDLPESADIALDGNATLELVFL